MFIYLLILFQKSALNAQNLERHSKKHELKPDTKFHSYKNKKRQQSAGGGSDVEYDNGDISPLYSNWDQETQEHLLPLQHYIMEQAQLSGNYLFGDPLDSDSFHSDTQSEHSLSGHEPDNEDSDHSNDRGDYLAHHYSGMDDYGEFYYNVDFGLDRLQKEDNLSEEVEAKLENEVGQIYSPVRDHPFFQQQQRLQKQKEEQQAQQKEEQQREQQREQQKQQYQQQHQQQQQPQHQQKQQQQSATIPKQHPPKPPRKQQSVPRPPPSSLMAQSTQPDAIPNTSNTPTIRLPQQMPTVMKECDIEKFAQDNLNLHSKGIFRKKSSIRDMLSWTAETISRPMLALSRDKAGKKMATEMFKLVQIYMGDRKARDGMSLNSVAIDIISSGLIQVQLRDELYIQLCRQTTENHKRESLIRGWELLAICLSFLPPSPTFQPALLKFVFLFVNTKFGLATENLQFAIFTFSYMNRHRDLSFAASFPEVGKWPIHVQVSHYASVACRRLERIGSAGKKQAKKPTDDDVNQSRVSRSLFFYWGLLES